MDLLDIIFDDEHGSKFSLDGNLFLHRLNNIHNNPDIIILLQPTSPLRPAKSLDSIINKFIDGRTKEQILIDRHNKKKAVLKKARKKKTKVINERTETAN